MRIILLFLSFLFITTSTNGQTSYSIDEDAIRKRGKLSTAELQSIKEIVINHRENRFLWLVTELPSPEAISFLGENLILIKFKDEKTGLRRYPVFDIVYDSKRDLQQKISVYLMDNIVPKLKHKEDYPKVHYVINKAYKTKIKYLAFIDSYLKDKKYKKKRKVRKMLRICEGRIWDYDE